MKLNGEKVGLPVIPIGLVYFVSSFASEQKQFYFF